MAHGWADTKWLNVIDVVRRPDTADRLRVSGARAVVIAGSDLAEQARAILGSRRLSLVLDGVGGDSVGQLINNLHLHGLWLERWLREASYQDIVTAYQEIAPLLADGTLKAPVAATYGLEDFAEALRESRTYDRDGKIVFTFTG